MEQLDIAAKITVLFCLMKIMATNPGETFGDFI